MKQARHDYIAFQDSDDIWYPNKLELEMHALFDATQEAGVSATGVSSNGVQTILASCMLVQKYKKAYIETDLLMRRLETILKDAEKVGMTDKIVPLLDK